MPRPSKTSGRGQRPFTLVELLTIEAGFRDNIPVRVMAEKIDCTYASIYKRYERFRLGETVLTPELVRAVSKLVGARTLPNRHYATNFELTDHG